jgi:uncharacterized protein YjbI with pentapeptide repeats
MWTGFGPYDEATQGPRSKTLWDWLELLIIPAALGIGAATFQYLENNKERNLRDELNQQRIFDDYIEEVSEKLSQYTRDELINNEKMRLLLSANTAFTLNRLTVSRRTAILQFLHQAELITLSRFSRRNIEEQKAVTSVIKLKNATLHDIDLSLIGKYEFIYDINLSETNLRKANMNNTRISRCFFQEAELTEANFQDSEINTKCRFNKANMKKANLRNTKITGASFLACRLREVDLRRTHIKEVYFGDADLTRAMLQDSIIIDTDFRRADCTEAKFIGADMENAHLQETIFKSADLSRANLVNAMLTVPDFSDANLKEANLSNSEVWVPVGPDGPYSSEDSDLCNMERANLELAILNDTFLIYTNLKLVKAKGATFVRSNLSHADFSRADLRNTDFTSANLQDANLQGANLSSAILKDADLRHANLTNANLRGVDLSKAKLAGAIMPDGQVYES